MRHWKSMAAACMAVAVLGALALAPGEAQAITCSVGEVCVFANTNYLGGQGTTVCSAAGLHPLANWKNSGINNCANRAVWFRFNGVLAQCLDFRQASPNFGRQVNEIWIGADGSRC